MGNLNHVSLCFFSVHCCDIYEYHYFKKCSFIFLFKRVGTRKEQKGGVHNMRHNSLRGLV